MFQLTPAVIEKVGFFDENFYPAYFDDNDYRWRTKTAKADLDKYPVKYEHDTSSTIKYSAHYKKCNQKTFQKAGRYYITKWGGGPGEEKYDSPFNSGAPIDYWKIDPSQLNKLRWV